PCTSRFHSETTPRTYTHPLHDALPIKAVPVGRRIDIGHRRHCSVVARVKRVAFALNHMRQRRGAGPKCEDRSESGHTHQPPATEDRKSTRLNSSHVKISYAVFCLKKQK